MTQHDYKKSFVIGRLMLLNPPRNKANNKARVETFAFPVKLIGNLTRTKHNRYPNFANTSATVVPIAAGVGQIMMPRSFNIATFSAAPSLADEIIAPA